MEEQGQKECSVSVCPFKKIYKHMVDVDQIEGDRIN